ncbi:hypothetical protein [Gracilibacillus kekensis]|uniref:ABC-2 family transporter protein n=1 Tax=Gracilibacillus kekensis TaxID=1027249 RepID=A0A1M7QHW7_9BACI|nr:hypothetical protein [Gracilibacillus kekensis]SHN30496.1 hypothetical protein SAMN05216179_3182 [Gracilibacillus kekensis]
MWKDSWWLAKKELSFQFPGILLTLLATIIIAFFTVPQLDALVREMYSNETLYWNPFLLDLIFLGVTPSFSALFVWGPYLSLRTIKEDPFGKRMALYRSLPISMDVLIRSRILSMLVIFIIMSSAFYTIIFLMLPDSFFYNVEASQFLRFALTWFGYALVLGSVNTYIEFGTNGRVLYIFPLLFLIVIVLVRVACSNIWNMGVVEASILLVSRYSNIIVIATIILGVLGCVTISRMLKKRLLTRDFI